MYHLLECWDQVAKRVRETDAVVLFLDFDGTLVRLRARPEDVWLRPATRRALLRLARLPRVRICVISGRRQADVRDRIGVPRVRYLGLQGWEVGENGHAPKRLSDAARSLLAMARGSLAARIEAHLPGAKGVWMEDKGATLALHYRGAKNVSSGSVRALIGEALDPLRPGLRLMQGDHAWEILPREVGDKGTAALEQWRAIQCRALSIFVGNDATDEPAFAALAGGITVRVGPRRRSRARFHLHRPAEVGRFLELLETELRGMRQNGFEVNSHA